MSFSKLSKLPEAEVRFLYSFSSRASRPAEPSPLSIFSITPETLERAEFAIAIVLERFAFASVSLMEEKFFIAFDILSLFEAKLDEIDSTLEKIVEILFRSEAMSVSRRIEVRSNVSR